jgi:CobQ-like glutamine amidotransferase family enzyme
MQHQKGHQASSVERNLGFQDSGGQPLLEPETRAFGRVLDAKGSRGPVGDAEGLPLVGRAFFSCTVVNLKHGLSL